MMFSASDDLAPGVTFGGYVVHELIGRGGMASVYRAEHVLLEKAVALKVMDRSLLASSIGLARFLREGRAAAAIKHPNVVDINDVGVHDGVPYLVMELLKGKDLAAHLAEHRQLDSAATVRLALPVISALNTAHASGVVHRDIKPSNIFMSVGPDDQLVPKVLDFGISKMTLDRATLERAATPQNQIIGTPQYLPPEALQGVGEMGPLSDQYSLGVVLYQCVTGRTPFAGDTLLALLESLSRGTFPPPRALAPSVSAGLEKVILRALSASPADRFPTIRDMGRALIELAAERTQVVWRQSFATPAHGHDASTAGGFDVSGGRGSSLNGDLSLTPSFAQSSTRWRRLSLGMGLVLCGALAASAWSIFVRDPVPTGHAMPGVPGAQNLAASPLPPGASATLGSVPAGSVPAGSVPAGSVPAGSVPAGSVPPGAAPPGATAPGSTPTSSPEGAPAASPDPFAPSVAGTGSSSTRVLGLSPASATGSSAEAAGALLLPSGADPARDASSKEEALDSTDHTDSGSTARTASARGAAARASERTAKAKRARAAKAAKARRAAAKASAKRRGSSGAEAPPAEEPGVDPTTTEPVSSDAADAPPLFPEAPGSAASTPGGGLQRGANGAPILD